MNKLLLPCAMLFVVAQVISANDEDARVCISKPPLHPIDQKVVLDTFVPELGYYFTRAASKESVAMGPCSPCVCMQVCNPNNDECLYIHQNVGNDSQEPAKKVREHFTMPDKNTKPDLDVTLFTHDPLSNKYFPEGNHKKRILKLAEVLKENAIVQKESIYYNQTSREEDAKQGKADRMVLFKNKQPYRMNIEKQEGVNSLDALRDYRLDTYLDLKLRKKFADRVYVSHKDSIHKKIDNPLFQIKKPNVTTINNLPPSLEDPIMRYNDVPSVEMKPQATFSAENLVYWFT